MFRRVINYYRDWFTQISLITAIKMVKIMRLKQYITLDILLNDFMNHFPKEINKLIETDKTIKFTRESNIMYKEHIPENQKDNNKKVLFVGGRNSMCLNNEFSTNLSNHLGLSVISFQYDGYYGSGISNRLTYESYIKSIKEVFNEIKSETNEIYIIGYSLGCYGAYVVNEEFNKRSNVILISPFHSLQKTVRNVIKIDEFHLNNRLFYDRIMKSKVNSDGYYRVDEEKLTKVSIFSYNNDEITPIKFLDDEFLNSNITINKRKGNHITGTTDDLFPFITDYVNS